MSRDAPNAVLVPFIRLETHLNQGVLVTAANIGFQAAHVDDAGKFTAIGNIVNTTIPDINNLPTDLATLASQIVSAETALITVVGEINAIRKLV